MGFASEAQAADRGSGMTIPLSEELSHFCRGCGSKLPIGFRGHFHRECLGADKRWRLSEQRRREQERFKRRLERQSCPHCGLKYGDPRSDGNDEPLCEASRASQESDPPAGEGQAPRTNHLRADGFRK